MQRTRQFSKLLRLVATGKNWRSSVALLLLAVAVAARAEEPLPANELAFLTAVQQNQKLERRDLFFFFHDDFEPHNCSSVWLSVRADYYQYAFNDQFTRRQEPPVAGIKATFSF